MVGVASASIISFKKSRDEDGFLVGRAKVGGQEIEFVDHLQFDDDGRIASITVFFRPLPAATVALR